MLHSFPLHSLAPAHKGLKNWCSKLPEGHHPRGTTLPRLSEEICLSEGSAGVSQRALRRLSGGSAASRQGFYGALRGSAGFSEVSRG